MRPSYATANELRGISDGISRATHLAHVRLSDFGMGDARPYLENAMRLAQRFIETAGTICKGLETLAKARAS